MTNDGQVPVATVEKATIKRPPKRQKRQLRVAFDTNALYTGSASDLVRQEIATLIAQSVYLDLEITWYLAEIVRHERQYQMCRRASELLPPVAKVERLLGHNLNITEEVLIERVAKVAEQRQKELGLVPLKLDYARVDWERLAMDAAYRRAPFQEGDKEKGFRDALVVECFMQLGQQSPKTPKACRLVLVSGDKLVSEAIGVRMADCTNVSVLPSLEDLKGLINTLVSEVDETFIAQLRPKAEKLFFVLNDRSTLYYKEQIREKLTQKFALDLRDLPVGASDRENGTWTLYPPNFSKKVGQRVHWISRIAIAMEASKKVTDETQRVLGQYGAGKSYTSALVPYFETPKLTLQSLANPSSWPDVAVSSKSTSLADLINRAHWGDWIAGKKVVTHTGIDTYDVLWSADVTTSWEFRRTSVDDIMHVEGVWEQVT